MLFNMNFGFISEEFLNVPEDTKHRYLDPRLYKESFKIEVQPINLIVSKLKKNETSNIN